MTFIDPQAKLFGHMDRLAQIRSEGRTEAPVNVEVDLSNRCSLGCEWCHFAYTHTRGPLKGKRLKPLNAVPGGDLMGTDFALDMVEQFATAGVRSVTWTGGGEPTLHPDFDKIILHARRFVSQGIYTHGGHIDDHRADILKDAMRFVYVSLDAADRESYKRDKGVDRFADACAGIRRLAGARGAATIGVGFLVTETNWRDIPRMAKLGDHLQADYVQFRPTILYDQLTPGVPSEDTGWLDDAITVLEGLEGPNIEADVARFVMYRDWGGHDYTTCWWSALQTVVTPNGKLWTCVNKREHPAAEIGDMSVESFEEIWARQTAALVTPDCRVMCRGHLPNQAVDRMMVSHPHPEFI